jgi:hypothetical protein
MLSREIGHSRVPAPPHIRIGVSKEFMPAQQQMTCIG